MRTMTFFSVFFLASISVIAQTIAIDTITELQMIGNAPGYPLNGNYIITQDIDASVTASWNGGQGFDPIGSWSIGFHGPEAIPFTGHLDGQDYTISGLVIKQPAEGAYFVGLFVSIGGTGQIENLNLLNCDIEGYKWVGAITGQNSGTISSCSISGTVHGTQYDMTGTIGGAAGENMPTGIISGCHVSGLVDSAGGGFGVGGLVGINSGAIHICYSDATVTAVSNVGGLVGMHTTPKATVCSGNPLTPGSLTNSYATGAVTGYGVVGGLVGYQDVTDEEPSYVSDCYSTGIVTGIGEYGSTDIGGLIGLSRGHIRNSYALGAVSGTEGIGGLVGGISYHTSELSQCYAAGNVTAESGYAGGLVGSATGPITACYATGNVTGGSIGVGGLVGNLDYGQVNQCFATGTVTGTDVVAGLVGFLINGAINKCYSTGSVFSSISPTPDNVAGLANGLPADVQGCFWDIDTSGVLVSSCGTGLTTVEMKQKATYENAGWDLYAVWGIKEGIFYPCLRWSDPACGSDATLSAYIQGGTLIRRELDSKQTFHVVVENAIGTVTYQWYFDSEGKSALPIVGADTSEYTINYLNYSDAGSYSCVVTDDYFTIESAPVQLLLVDQLPVVSTFGLFAVLSIIIVLGAIKVHSLRLAR